MRKKVIQFFFAGACFLPPHKGNFVKDDKNLNVLGKPLVSCGMNPKTGYYRDGFCATGDDDRGVHVVCAEVTEEFLQYSKLKGNDLITPLPQFDFKGLKPGDRWCLCAARWKEAFDAHVAPPVVLEATHKKALEFVTLENMQLSCGKK